MIKMTVVFENKISAPYNAEEFVKRHYLTDMAKMHKNQKLNGI